MSAQNRPVSKVSNKNFNDNFDRIFKKKEAPLKDRTKLGVSPSTEVINIDCTHPDPAMIEYTIRQLKNQSEGLRNILHHDKEHWEGFMVEEKEDE
jgi:hypothetical protein